VSDSGFNEQRPITRVIGMRLDELCAELGSPDVQHRQASGVWLIFRLEACDLRIVCTGDGSPVASSCTASLRNPGPTLSEATVSLGIWPDCQPDERADAVLEPLVRRSLSDPSGGVLSMTATVRNGLFTQVTVFDEEPDW